MVVIVLGGCDKPPDVVWVAPGSTPGVLLGGWDGWGEVYPLGCAVGGRSAQGGESIEGQLDPGAWADRCKVRCRAVVTQVAADGKQAQPESFGFPASGLVPVNAS